jgi:glycoprotein 6-alpha-L-fucosyltransferase
MYDVNDTEIAVKNRHSTSSIQGFLNSIHLLSQCEYVVCTLSSNVCRLVYELMQSRYVDAAWRFKSLDESFHVHQELEYLSTALYDYTPHNSGDIEMKQGDQFYPFKSVRSEAGKKQPLNGYVKVMNRVTRALGTVPGYKIFKTPL